MKNIFTYISEQIAYLPLISRMSKYNTKNNYQNFILGRIWQYANPIIMATFYYIVFGFIFKSSLGATEVPYLPWMLVGMAIWGLTNGTVLQSLGSIIGQLNLSNEFRFPVSISPTITFIGNIVESLVVLFVAAAVGWANGYYPSMYWFQLIYYFIAITAFTVSYSLLNATLTTIFRDYSQIVRSFSPIGMFISGVTVVSNSARPHRRQPTRLPHPWDSPGKNTGVGCHFLLQCMKVKSEVKSLSRVRLLATPWTATHQAPASMGFSRQECWSGVPLPSPRCF